MIVTETRAEATIRTNVCQAGSPMQTLDLRFTYDRSEPYEIVIPIGGGFLPRGQLLVPRRVLDSGRYKHVRPAGGQVSAYPDRFDRRFMHIGIETPCGRAALHVATVAISDFLDATYDIVNASREAEHLAVPSGADYDRWLFRLGDAA